MTSHHLLVQPRTWATFDIETVLDEGAVAAAGYKGNGMPSALQRMETACIFVATEEPDGTWQSFSLRTFGPPDSEFDLLMRLDDEFLSLAGRKAVVATYNGRAHDLAVLRRRCARHWMFGLPGIAAAATMDHFDVMLRQRADRRDGAPSLRDACAGFGISAVDTRGFAASALPRKSTKCQTDVVATFLLVLYELAIERGSPDPLLAGWEGLSTFLGAMRPRLTHLEHIRNHHLLRIALRARDDPATTA